MELKSIKKAIYKFSSMATTPNLEIMADTYTQLFVHVVFAVKGRDNLISVKWKDSLYKYITGIISNKDQKLIIINGMPDHVHILISFQPSCILSDLVRDVKANSSRWINENKYVAGKFEWQNGFGAFTVNPYQLKTLIEYISNQEEHHKRKTFRDEYVKFLNENNIEYKPEYLFEEIGGIVDVAENGE